MTVLTFLQLPCYHIILHIIYIICSFSSLILSLVIMISFYFLSKRFFLKYKGLSDTRVASTTKKGYGFAVHFL